VFFHSNGQYFLNLNLPFLLPSLIDRNSLKVFFEFLVPFIFHSSEDNSLLLSFKTLTNLSNTHFFVLINFLSLSRARGIPFSQCNGRKCPLGQMRVKLFNQRFFLFSFFYSVVNVFNCLFSCHIFL